MSLTEIHPSQRHAQIVRARLRSPPNSVADQGIALHHPKGVNGVDAAKSREAEMLLAEERRFTFIPIKDNETPAERFPERVEKTPPKFIDRIRHRVVKEFDTTLGKLDCDRRAFEYVIPRHVAMYLCKELTLHSYPTIGRKFGGKDHTSVMHAAKGCPARMLKDAFLCQTVVDLQAELEQEIIHWRSGGELRNK